MRTGRSNGTTAYTYTYNGGQLSQMTVNGKNVTFSYDASGAPQTMTYDGVTYYYITNPMGDVTGIANESGTQLVFYYYTAYGTAYVSYNTAYQALGATLSGVNPLFYRGYVYDQETGLYYLQSRYYNPKVGRFINADMLLATGQGLLGNNMFAYCLNNPTNNADDAGTVARSCLHDSGAIDDSPWRDHSIGGGGRPRRNYTSGNDYGEVADKFYTVILLKAVGNALGAGAKHAWDLFQNGYEMYQNAQLLDAQLKIEGVKTAYDFLDESGAIAVGTFGYNTIMAAKEGKKALTYLALPIPGPSDEAFAVMHALKALYHLINSPKKVVEWSERT